jgi:indolepyruvate ferredoxin oxidoreductase beta subunit
MRLNLIVAGVGGQGSVLASHILAEAAIASGLPARVGETFGAAMRGGAVASHVRMGDVAGPLVKKGGADAILALEPLEGLRVGVDYLSSEGVMILNTRPLYPVDTSIGVVVYPPIEQIVADLEALGKAIYPFDATELAIQAGNARTLNSVILGALAGTGLLPFSADILEAALVERVPPSSLESNRKAFHLGLAYMEGLNQGGR